MCVQVLKDLQRVLDEMALGVGSDAHSARNAALILEAVPVVSLAVVFWCCMLSLGCWYEVRVLLRQLVRCQGR